MAYQLKNLNYLPEKSWDQVVRGENYYWPAWEWLPVTNTFLDASRGFSQFARQANNPLEWATDVVYWLGSLWGSVVVWPVVDTLWNIWNAAANGYKRLYNNGAALYNYGANTINDYLVNKELANKAQQTSMTWRRMPVSGTSTSNTQTAQQRKGAKAEQKMDVVQEAKKLVTNELKRMNAAWELLKDVSKTKRLINLYKKLK